MQIELGMIMQVCKLHDAAGLATLLECKRKDE